MTFIIVSTKKFISHYTHSSLFYNSCMRYSPLYLLFSFDSYAVFYSYVFVSIHMFSSPFVICLFRLHYFNLHACYIYRYVYDLLTLFHMFFTFHVFRFMGSCITMSTFTFVFFILPCSYFISIFHPIYIFFCSL